MSIGDFFRPTWKHSNPEVRARAIRALDDEQQGILINVSLQDPSLENRRSASRKLHTPALLERFINETSDEALREDAARRLNHFWAKEARESDGPEGESYVARLEDQNLLEDVVLRGQSSSVKRAAFNRITQPSSFLAIAMKETDRQLAVDAVNRLTNEKSLQAVEKGAALKAVKEMATRRLKELGGQEGMSDEAMQQAKVNLLFRQMESTLSDAGDEELYSRFPELESAWFALEHEGFQASDQQRERFRSLKEQIDLRCDRFLRDKASRQLEQERLTRNLESKLEICDQMEALNPYEGEDRYQQLDSLKHQWEKTGGVPPEKSEALDFRFQRSLEALERERIQFQRRVRRQAEAHELFDSMLRAIEKVDPVRNPEMAMELAEQIEADAPAILERFDDAKWVAKQQEQLRVSLAELRKKAEEGKEVHAAQAEKNLEQKQALLTEMENLIHIPDLKEGVAGYRRIKHDWNLLGPAPEEAEFALQQKYQDAAQQFHEAQDWARWANLREKEAICERLEKLTKEAEKAALVSEFKEMREKWKQIGPVPYENSEVLWDRYRQANDEIFEKCREYFAELDEEREENYKSKQEMVGRIESLVRTEPEDWRDAVEFVKEAQGNWRIMGAVPKDKSEELWTRFRQTCDEFFAKRDAHYKQVDSERQMNLARKEELCRQVEELKDSTDWKQTSKRIQEIQEDWKKIGPVPREQAEAIWNRFHDNCDRFFQALKQHYEELDKQRPENLVRKEALCEAVENLQDSETDEEKFQRIKQAQGEWKLIGPVPREMEQAIWERFRKACDIYFEGRRERYEQERHRREENLKIKEELCVQAEAMTESTDWKLTTAKYKELQEKWKQLGPVPRENDKQIWTRFRKACDGFFNRLKENVSKMEEERHENLQKKEALCQEVESIVGIGEEDAAAGISDLEQSAEKIKELQRQWKRIGPVPREHSESIWKRFRKACDIFFEEKRNQQGDPPGDRQDNLEAKLALCEEAERIADEGQGVDQQDKIKGLQRQWKTLGPVPAERAEELWQRFRESCDHVFAGEAEERA